MCANAQTEANLYHLRVGKRHGVLDSDNNLVYFMPYDGNKDIPDSMGIRSNDFLLYLKSKIDPKHLIVLIDACNAAAATTDDRAAKDDASED